MNAPFFLLQYVAGNLLLLARALRTEHGPCAPSTGVIFGNAGITAAVIVCFVQAALLFI